MGGVNVHVIVLRHVTSLVVVMVPILDICDLKYRSGDTSVKTHFTQYSATPFLNVAQNILVGNLYSNYFYSTQIKTAFGSSSKARRVYTLFYY